MKPDELREAVLPHAQNIDILIATFLIHAPILTNAADNDTSVLNSLV